MYKKHSYQNPDIPIAEYYEKNLSKGNIYVKKIYTEILCTLGKAFLPHWHFHIFFKFAFPKRVILILIPKKIWYNLKNASLASNNSIQKIRAFISSIFSNGFSSNQKKQAWECLSSIGGTIHKMMQKISNPFFKEWYG